MNARTLTFTTLLLLSGLLLSGCSDQVPFAGGALAGNLTPVPGDWAAVAEVEVIQLEVSPEDPYSVKLWVVGMGPLLYIHAGANRATWVEHIEVNAEVRLLIDEALYELEALRVEDADEFATFADAYELKYGNRPRNEDVTEAYLFRLGPR